VNNTSTLVIGKSDLLLWFQRMTVSRSTERGLASRYLGPIYRGDADLNGVSKIWYEIPN